MPDPRALLADMEAQLRQQGIDPNSPEGRAHRQQMLEMLVGMGGRGAGTNVQEVPPGQSGGFGSRVTPNQTPGFESRVTPNIGQMGGPQPQMPQPPPQTAPEPIRLPEQQLDVPRRAPPKWMQNEKTIERTMFTMTGKLRTEEPPNTKASRKRGHWIPFESMPRNFKRAFMEEYGDGMPPAGWWSKELNRRERMMANHLALNALDQKRSEGEPDEELLASNQEY